MHWPWNNICRWITAVPARQLVCVVKHSSNQGYLFQQQMTWLDADGRGWETQFHTSLWSHWLWCVWHLFRRSRLWFRMNMFTILHFTSKCVTLLTHMNERPDFLALVKAHKMFFGSHTGITWIIGFWKNVQSSGQPGCMLSLKGII